MATNNVLEDEALAKVGRQSHWLLRFPIFSVFLYMGIDKFMGGGIGEFAQMAGLPWLIAALVALAEISAGVLIVAGPAFGSWITRLGALFTLPVLLGAIFMVHWGQWHFLPTATHPMGGMMFQVTLFMLALYLLIHGNEA
jgi:putative oxidoreductase